MRLVAEEQQEIMARSAVRHDWHRGEIQALFDLPFNDLLFQAATIHRQYFSPNEVQVSTLLSIKTGACPEDCKYCSQSGHHNTGLEKEKLMAVAEVIKEAQAAKTQGASRFCMGAAWRSPRAKDMPTVLAMVKEVKALGLETCMTLGMLSAEQAQDLAQAGLDYYNHNLDTSREHYKSIVTTRTYDDRLTTLAHVRDAGMKVCAGGILGMGEQREDRVGLLQQLANLPQHPESVPINMLVKVKGTPLGNSEDLDPLEFVRTVAVARILMPASYVRLSAGRQQMDDSTQALCFLAGANSLFCGERLLTTDNPSLNKDEHLFARLGIQPMMLQCVDSDEELAAGLTEQTAMQKGLYYNALVK